MLPRSATVIEAVKDLFFPRHCVGCGSEGEFICSSCQKTISRIFAPVCPLCGRPQSGGVLCSSCIDWNAAIDGVRSPFRFAGVIRDAVHRLKYNNLRDISGLLSEFMARYLEKYPLNFDILVPVPLHPKRLKERGYNQSALLAAKLSELTGAPLVEGSLERTKNSIPQVKTESAAERRANVQGIFKMETSALRGKNVLLIDDVCTSGATLNECATALKQGGSASVWGLTLAREI